MVGLLCSSVTEDRVKDLKMVNWIKQKKVRSSGKFEIPQNINWSAERLLEITPLILETELASTKKFNIEQLESVVDSHGSIQKFLQFDCHSQLIYSSLYQNKKFKITF